MKKSKVVVLCNEKAIQEVAEELGVDRKLVAKIVDTQSQYTKKIMESGTFDSIRWPYFAVFKVNPKKIQIINHLKGLSPEQQKQFKKDIKDGKVYQDFKRTSRKEQNS